MSLATPRWQPVARYSLIAMALHWLIAVLILVNVVVGLRGATADDKSVRAIVDLHKSIGLTVLGLVILRILWRFAKSPPALPATYSKAERTAAHAAHLLLYVVMLMLPLSGYLHDSAWNKAATHPIVLYGLVHFPRIGFIESMDPATKEQLHSVFGAVHVYFGYALYVLLALHLLAVVKHHAIDRERELQRMLPGVRGGGDQAGTF